MSAECTGSWLFVHVGVKGDEVSYKSSEPVFSREAVFPVFVHETLDDSIYRNFCILVIQNFFTVVILSQNEYEALSTITRIFSCIILHTCLLDLSD